MAFYSEIESRYGSEAKLKLKLYANLNRKLVLTRSRRWFLLKCRSERIFPKHIVQNFNCAYTNVGISALHSSQLSKIIHKFKKQLLNLEIKITVSNLNKLREEIDIYMQWINVNLPQEVRVSFFGRQKVFSDKFFERKNTTLNVKFFRLLEEQRVRTHQRGEGFLINLTAVEVPGDVEGILGLSPSVNLPFTLKSLPVIDLITDVEMIIGGVDGARNRMALRSEACTVVRNGITRYKNQPEPELCKSVRRAKGFLRDNPEVILIRSDKSNASVLMYRDEYVTKMDDLLKDTSVYKIGLANPTSGLQDKCNAMVERLVDLGVIPENRKMIYKSRNAVAPKIYGLPKCHKEGNPLRPVVSCLGSPGLKLSGLVKDLLQPLKALGDYDVKNSYGFQEEIVGKTIRSDEIMVSFDVVSLFTNVPLELVVYLVMKHWALIEVTTTMPMGVFLDLLELTAMNGYFKYQDKFVKQRSGCAMGGVLSSDLAGIVMIDLLNWVVPQLPFQLTCLCRYVDDLFLILPESAVEDTLVLFNSYHPQLRFTCEREHDSRLPFLDTMVVRDPAGNLLTDWYRKPCAADRCLDFRTSHAFSMKMSCAKELLTRVLRLSSPQFHTANREKVSMILRRNGYPRALVSRLVNGWSPRPDPPALVDNPEAPVERPAFASLTYVQGISPKLKALLERECQNVRIVYGYKNRVSRLHTPLKARDSLMLQSQVIYRIDCGGCCSCYIGQTKQYIKDRNRQHANDCRAQGREPECALAQHAIEHDHGFKFEETTVLDREPILGRRLFKEMAYIHMTPSACNKRTDTSGLSSVYSGILAEVSELTTYQPTFVQSYLP